MSTTSVTPFDDHIGTEIVEATADRVIARLIATTKHLQPLGLVHGGVYATLAETTASIGASLEAKRAGTGVAAIGIENHTTFLRSTGEGAAILATATPVHAGRRIQAWHVSMTDENTGRELATAQMRLFVVSAPS